MSARKKTGTFLLAAASGAALMLAACGEQAAPGATAQNGAQTGELAAAAQTAAQDCDRACLENWVDVYLDGLIANDPAAARVAPGARYTSNGQLLDIGDGIWRSARSKGTYRLYVTDVPAQQVTVLTNWGEDVNDSDEFQGAAMALRLKIENDQITEIEDIVIRDQALYDRLEAARPREAYFETIPEDERMSRAELIETANKYFTGMQRNDGLGDYPFGDRCDRFENATLTTNQPTPEGQTRPDPRTSPSYSAQWSCLEQFESGLLHFVSRIRDRRYVAVDEERGVVFAFGFFDHQAGDTRNFTLPDGREVSAGPVRPWTWHIAETFKIENGLLQEIDAYLYEPPYGMISGWSSWEDGMSDRIQNATGVD